MSLFEYLALDERGKRIKGVVNADTLALAKESLQGRSIFITDIHPFHSKKIVHLSSRDVLGFTRDLGQLLGASLPLYDSLKAIVEKSEGQKGHQIFVDLCDMVKQGKSLSAALRYYEKSFSPVYISMVEAGEESGRLDRVFTELLRMLTKQEKLKKQLSSAMVYPLFLAAFCMVVVTGLFTFLIPSMRELLDGRELHPFTQSIVAVSDWMSGNIMWLLPSFLIAFLLLLVFFNRPQGKRVWESLTIRLPLVGKMQVQSIMLKFCRTFSVLLASDVSVVKAIELSSNVMNHHQFQEVMESARDKLIEGKKLSEILSRSRLIPKLVVRMLATAEETASLDKMLGSIADIYEEDLDKNIQQFAALIQPVMILLLGLIIGVVLLAVLLPLTDVTSFLN